MDHILIVIFLCLFYPDLIGMICSLRKQLAKRRKKEAEDAEHLRQCIAAAKLVKIYRQHQKWCEFLKLAERIRKDLYKHR